MKVHRFECKNSHTFYIPLNLPMDMMRFAESLSKMKCPLCNCNSKEIAMGAQEYTVS